MNEEKIKYDTFIYHNQFRRKIYLFLFLLTKRSLMIIGAIIAIVYFRDLIPYSKYIATFFMLLLFILYMRTGLTYMAKIKELETPSKEDEKSGGIMLLSVANNYIKQNLKDTQEYAK